MAWVAVAIGGGTAIAKAISANQSKQRTKGYINDEYRTASQKLDIEQRGARQSIAESANSRGLGQAGSVSASPIRATMVDGLMRSTGRPNTIGGQEAADAGVQMGLESKDLNTQHDRALKQNKTNYANALLDAGVSGVNAGVSAYGAEQDLKAMRDPGASGFSGDQVASALDAAGQPLAGASFTPTAAPKLDRSAIHSAMLSATSFSGVHPNDPLGDPTSAWSTHPKTRLAGGDETNASFNVGD